MISRQRASPGTNTFLPEANLKIAHSLDGINWTILPSSVVDITGNAHTGDEDNAFKNFIGHIGGDDFVIIKSPENLDSFCQNFIWQFDDQIKYSLLLIFQFRFVQLLLKPFLY